VNQRTVFSLIGLVSFVVAGFVVTAALGFAAMGAVSLWIAWSAS
jgi:hypothetical protein